MSIEQQNLIASVVVRERGSLTRRVCAAFPTMSRQVIDEAVAEAVVVALQSPNLHTEQAIIRFLFVVARREARGSWRRRAYSAERGGDALDHVNQGQASDAENRLDDARALAGKNALIDEAGRKFGGNYVDAVTEALCELASDDEDSVEAAAARHGVSRFSVSRARAWMRRVVGL